MYGHTVSTGVTTENWQERGRGGPRLAGAHQNVRQNHCQSVYPTWVHSELGWSGRDVSRVGRYGSMVSTLSYNKKLCDVHIYVLYVLHPIIHYLAVELDLSSSWRPKGIYKPAWVTGVNFLVIIGVIDAWHFMTQSNFIIVP